MIKDAIIYERACNMRDEAETQGYPEPYRWAGDMFAKLGMDAAAERCYERAKFYGPERDRTAND